MRRGGFTIIEVVVVFLLMLGVLFLVLPASFNSTKQARFISQWTTKYSELQYMFSVIKAQKDGELTEKFKVAQNNDDRKNILIDAIKPYLRITSEVGKEYHQHYMNKSAVGENDTYSFDYFYQTSADEIVALKWVKTNCTINDACAIMMFDVNGVKPPNIWGQDIFGVNIFKDKIEPFGRRENLDVLKNDCSRYGFGIYCSYYYLIGGEFD